MKKCPKCGKTYDDSWGICLDCRIPLQEMVETTKNQHHSRTYLKNYTYLKNRESWKNLKDGVLLYINKIFDGDDSSCNDFVTISERYNLVQGNYLSLQKSFPEPYELIPYFAVTLERLGAMLMEKFNETNNRNYGIEAKKCYQLSIKLNPYLTPSYGALAITCVAVDNNRNDAIEYCDKGIKIFGKLQSIPNEQLNYYNQALKNDVTMLTSLKEWKNKFIKGEL